jgi:hypothetical protein
MKRKRDIEKKNEGTHKHRKEMRNERERESEFYDSSSNNRDATFDVSFDIYIQVIIRGGMHMLEAFMLSNVAINILVTTDVILTFHLESI